MEKRLVMFFACLFLSLGMALAQTRVTGTVVSAEDGEPVIGASIKVLGTNTGTVTDADGKFQLNVAKGAELEISYIGMQTKRVVVKGGTMSVLLEGDENTLDELVVTGYGSSRKLGTIAGSVATVSGDKLSTTPVANVTDALQGQVAGLQVFTSSGEPSATASMRIRGVTSLYATTEPLYILDGSEISSGAFLALNPNDIENITVLKDASSTAIYGSRAANGVIIITSKKGNFGEAPTITISAQYGISQMTSDHENMMDANQWLDFQEMVDPSNTNNANFQAKKAYYRKYGISTDWRDVFFGDSKPVTQIDASVRGGSNNLSYLLSFNHYNTEGIMDDSNMRRESLRANLEANVNSWLKVGSNTNLAFTRTETTAFGSQANSVYNKSFAARVYIPTSSLYEILGLDPSDYANSTFEGYGKERYKFDDMGSGYYNPYWLSEIQPRHSDQVRLNENLYVNLNPIKGLNIRSAVGLDAYDSRTSAKVYNTLDIDPDVFPTGSASESFTRFYRWTVTNTAEYKFNFLRSHNVSVLLGQESMNAKSEGFSAGMEKLTDNRFMLMSAGVRDGATVPGHAISEEVRNSWFGMLNYSYDDRYFLDASIRRDGSSLFAEHHRWATFGAVAAMWNITNEDFMKSTKSWLNDLQFKLSYGSTGNSGISPYQYLGLASTSGEYRGQGGIAPANVRNDDLTWETVKTLNVALVGKVFNRFTFDVEFYNKVTSNMLVNVPYSYTTGFSSQWGNVAEMYNRGVDVTLGADIIKNKDWFWNVSLNFNYNKNEITKLFKGADSYDVTDLVHLEVGHPYGEYYYVRWSHVDPADGQNVWLDKNGNYTKTYSEDNRVMTGKTPIAPWSGGLSTTVAWKGLQLDVQFTGMFDRYMMNNERWFTMNPTFASSNNQSVDMFKMWQKPGDITDVAAADAEYQMDTHLIENASFVRLKFVQLSYTLPQKWMNSTHFIKGCKVYFVGRNLLTFTGYHGYDPEVDSFSTLGDYPNTRQYSFGLQLTF